VAASSFLTRLTEQHRFRYYDLCLSFFVVVLLISNLVAPKICQIGPFTLSGAQLLFPLTYIFGDIFTEVYGYAGSRRAIWHGFLAQTLLTVLAMTIVTLPPAPGWENQQAFETVFGFLPRLVVASLIAYWCGEFANSFVMAKMKIITKGKMLWARTIGSTAVGQLVDTVIVMIIGFGGTMSWDLIFSLIWSGYVVKVLYEAAATPVTYLVVNALKKAEGVDLYDTDTDFNPFARMS
jgi:queuosine precursor transporter